MSFTYSVIGSNTPENREHLEKIGYVRGFFNIPNRGYIKTINPGIYNLTNIIQPLTEYINCIGNDALFQAVTAISSTTDIGKYYINNHTGRWKRCDYNMATDENIDWGDWTEATLTELQEHFKRV